MTFQNASVWVVGMPRATGLLPPPSVWSLITTSSPSFSAVETSPSMRPRKVVFTLTPVLPGPIRPNWKTCRRTVLAHHEAAAALISASSPGL